MAINVGADAGDTAGASHRGLYAFTVNSKKFQVLIDDQDNKDTSFSRGNGGTSAVGASLQVGVMGNFGQANYSAAKAGLIGLTKTTAREVASRGINVNAVAPGFIDTEMTKKLDVKVRNTMLEQIPLGKLGTPEDVAECVAFLVSSKAKYITGQVININGGMLM